MGHMRTYNISANLVRTIEQLYDKATSAVQINGSIGWLVGCFGFNGPLRQYFSLYRTGQHRRMVQNNSRSKAMMPSVIQPLQHFS